MAEKANPGTGLGEKQAVSAKTTLGGDASARVGQASARVGQASARVGQASARVGQASAQVSQAGKSAAVGLADRPEDVAAAVSRAVDAGGSATVRLKGRALQSALAKLGDKVDALSAVVTLRGSAPAK